jgi:hypothetical protein
VDKVPTNPLNMIKVDKPNFIGLCSGRYEVLHMQLASFDGVNLVLFHTINLDLI